MLLLAALSAATLAVVVRAELLPSELKTNKNESETLANALRNKLMSENYDYVPRESGEPSHSAASYEEQEPTAVHARARDLRTIREQYEDQKQESSKVVPDETDDNLVEMQRAVPVSGNIAHDPNAVMRHDNPKLGRNGDDDVGKNTISWHFDGTMKMKPGGYNERDERYLDKGSNKYTLKQSQNDDKRAKLQYNDLGDVDKGSNKFKLKQISSDDKRAKMQYNDLGDDNPSKRKDRHDDFKHIDQEPDYSAKLIRDTENDQIDKDAEMRREKIDKYKYDKHNDDQRLDRTDNRQTTSDNMEERRGKQNRPGDHRHEVSKLKNSKTSDFVQSERDKRIDMRFGKNVDPRYNDLEALKAAKREQDKRNDFRFDKSDHRRPDNLLYDKNNNFRQREREKLQLNSHENERLHDLSGDNRENIRFDERNNNRPYKSRFQKLNNVRPGDLRQNHPDKLTRDKMRQEKSDKFKYDKHDDVRQENLNGYNKNNQLKQDYPDNIKYGTRYDQKHDNNRHDKRNKLNEYDRDVFPQANNNSSKSNWKYNKYDGLRQDELRYDKIRHTKRDEMRKDEMKYDKFDKRDDFRQEKTDEIRHYDKKKQNLHVTNPMEQKRKHEPYVNNNKQDKSYHKQEIMKMGREHNQIKEKKLRQDYGVDDEYNKSEDNNRQRSKQKLDNPRGKPNENPRYEPRGLMHSKLNTQLREVPLKYDKLEQQLEKQFQRITPTTESDKDTNNKYTNSEKTENQYIKDRYEKYKRINNEYKYRQKQFNENDKNKRYRRINKGRPYRPQQRARDEMAASVTRHPSEDYISEHGKLKDASVKNGINSVYVPKFQDTDNNNNATADNVSGDDNFEQKEPGVSRRDLLYYVDDKKLAGLMGTDDVVDVPDVPAVETRRNAKKYKMLKMVRSGRRAGGGSAGEGEGAGGVVQEEGAGGVALLALGGRALPSFQLPRARRQYMPSDHDSDYQAGDLLDEDIPGLKEYPEPDLARMDLNLLSPPGLTASVQSSYNQLYSPSVNGPIVPEKEVGHGKALFDAMNVQSVLNE